MSFPAGRVRIIFGIMKADDENKGVLDNGTESLDSFELIIKKAEAKTAMLKLKREKLFHKKILEIAGYDNERTV